MLISILTSRVIMKIIVKAESNPHIIWKVEGPDPGSAAGLTSSTLKRELL